MRDGGRPPTAGSTSSTRAPSRAWDPQLDASASSPTSTPSATGPCATRWTPSRPRGAANGRPTRARTSPTSRSIHPNDIRVRGARRGRQRPALWACHEDQMDDLTIPFLGPERPTWQYPFARCCGPGHGSRWAPTGASRRRTRCSRWRWRSTGSPTTRGERPAFLPDRADHLEDALAGFTSARRG